MLVRRSIVCYHSMLSYINCVVCKVSYNNCIKHATVWRVCNLIVHAKANKFTRPFIVQYNTTIGLKQLEIIKLMYCAVFSFLVLFSEIVCLILMSLQFAVLLVLKLSFLKDYQRKGSNRIHWYAKHN